MSKYNTKECFKCKKLKKEDEFHKDKSKKDGLYSSCKACSYKPKDVEVLKRKARKELEEEFIGNVIGHWKVASVKDDNSRHISYNCECVCGKKRVIRKTVLKNGKTTSCGCEGNIFKGKRFHRLEVTTKVNKNSQGRLYVGVSCECGTEKNVLIQSLVSGATVSCGCYNKEVLMARTGIDNHNYKPELTDKERTANNTRGSQPHYQKFRREVLKRDSNTCVICGVFKEKDMRVHHLNSWNTHLSDRYNVDNAVTLCPPCHDIQFEGSFHNVYGNGNNTKEQFIEYKQQASNIS